ncbi:MAG: transposase, partial [Kiritimatiellia bacterium]
RVMSAGEQAGCALKRVAIMPDHMHVALRGNPKLSPQAIALGFQNAAAEAAGCRLWEDQFYVGTFGEYDKGAVRRLAG